MKKIILAILSVLTIVAIPLIGLPVYAAKVEDVYHNTYLAAMADKFGRLHALEDEKIILIGGSSMAFGVDCSAVERELGMPVVNMGLYAALGSKTTLDLTKSGIDKGDIVIFAPEMDTQAYSMYTNSEITIQALEANRNMIWQIPLSEWAGLFCELPSYITDKKDLLESGIPNPTNAYSRQAFNEYGDNVYDRPYNIMPDLYQTTNMIDVSLDLLDVDFIDYVNDYATDVQKKGAKFYFSFPPMNKLALTERSTPENRNAVYKELHRVLKCEVIGNIEDHIINEGYFYDSNYHLNNGGINVNTKVLVNDIKRQNADTSMTDIEILPPSGAENQEGDVNGSDEFSSDFEYVEEAGGYAVVSITADAAKKNTLYVPRYYNNKQIYKIKSRAFAGSMAVSINIGENITVFEDEVFGGCANLRTVNLSLKLGANDSLPSVGDNLLFGASDNLKIFVPPIKYSAMRTDYFWMRYSAWIYPAE